VINVILLPTAFLSGSFGPTRHYPEALQAIGDVLPLKYLIDLINAVYLHDRDIWNKGTAVAVLVAWGVAGLAIARRKFRWEPREG
jgi:ABC-2 type transport system permease protein